MKKPVFLRLLFRLLLFLFLLANFIAGMYAYKLTHFSANETNAVGIRLSGLDRLKLLFTGVDLKRPQNHAVPARPYQTITLQSNKRIEAWLIKANNSIGTVILFHGYGGEKSGMLDKADAFLKLGYSTLLVDFMGAGGSEGVQTTIGYKEAEEVKTCFDYMQQQSNLPIHLFGTSMGAVAIMKAMQDYRLKPASVMLECPFGTMYQTVCARFRLAHVPSFPLAGLMLFWGSVENGFWAFGHNPVQYARAITCPALLLWGEQDDRVSRAEIEHIFKNLSGPKRLVTYPLSRHENYLLRYRSKWTTDVQHFLLPSTARLPVAVAR